MKTARLYGRRQGRRVALALLVVTVTAAAVSAYLGRGYLVDSWWIWKLRSTDHTTRNLAAEKLAKRGCLRAVPEMVRAAAADPKERIFFGPSPEGLADRRTHRYATPLILALWNMGEAAIPAVEKAAGENGKPEMNFIAKTLKNRRLPTVPFPRRC